MSSIRHEHLGAGTRSGDPGQTLAAPDLLLLVPIPFVDLAHLQRQLLGQASDSRFVPIGILNELVH